MPLLFCVDFSHFPVNSRKSSPRLNIKLIFKNFSNRCFSIILQVCLPSTPPSPLLTSSSLSISFCLSFSFLCVFCLLFCLGYFSLIENSLVQEILTFFRCLSLSPPPSLYLFSLTHSPANHLCCWHDACLYCRCCCQTQLH